MEEFHVWSMADYLLGHYWNNGYNTFLENRSDVCNFVKLVELHFRQRMNFKLVTSLLLFWLMDKVTKLSYAWLMVGHLFGRYWNDGYSTFSICFQGYRGGDHVIRKFKIRNTRELNSSKTKKAFTDSFFDFSTNLLHFFSPQLFLKISTSTTIIRTWTVPLPRQNKYR